MEQKRILWIIAAVGVFLLAVIGAALILCSPTQTVDSSIASLQVQNDTWTKPETSVLPVQDNPEPVVVETVTPVEQDKIVFNPTIEELNVFAENTNVYGSGTTTIDLNTLKYNAPEKTSAVTAENQAAANAISSASNANAVAKKTTAVEENCLPAASEKVVSVKSETVKPKASATTKTNTSSAKPAATTKTTTTVKSAAETKTPDQYWVQAASFTNKTNAEEARAALTQNKIDSEIFTYTDSNGKVYYRLRVGPYTTKTEAEYWRSRIILIDEFANTQSYVTNTSAKKS